VGAASESKQIDNTINLVRQPQTYCRPRVGPEDRKTGTVSRGGRVLSPPVFGLTNGIGDDGFPQLVPHLDLNLLVPSVLDVPIAISFSKVGDEFPT